LHEGTAIIRHWGESRAVAVSPATLSLAAVKRRQLPPQA
jgi:hypothetical protein